METASKKYFSKYSSLNKPSIWVPRKMETYLECIKAQRWFGYNLGGCIHFDEGCECSSNVWLQNCINARGTWCWRIRQRFRDCLPGTAMGQSQASSLPRFSVPCSWWSNRSELVSTVKCLFFFFQKNSGLSQSILQSE